jgi:hypothetical protein
MERAMAKVGGCDRARAALQKSNDHRAGRRRWLAIYSARSHEEPAEVQRWINGIRRHFLERGPAAGRAGSAHLKLVIQTAYITGWNIDSFSIFPRSRSRPSRMVIG